MNRHLLEIRAEIKDNNEKHDVELRQLRGDVRYLAGRLDRTNGVVSALVEELEVSERHRVSSFIQYKSALEARFEALKSAVNAEEAERLLLKFYDEGANRCSELKRQAQELLSEPKPKAARVAQSSSSSSEHFSVNAASAASASESLSSSSSSAGV